MKASPASSPSAGWEEAAVWQEDRRCFIVSKAPGRGMFSLSSLLFSLFCLSFTPGDTSRKVAAGVSLECVSSIRAIVYLMETIQRKLVAHFGTKHLRKCLQIMSNFKNPHNRKIEITLSLLFLRCSLSFVAYFPLLFYPSFLLWPYCLIFLSIASSRIIVSLQQENIPGRNMN